MSALLAAYRDAMQAFGVPHEPLAVYDSNSWRRVGLEREYREVMTPTAARDGHPDIDGEPVLRAMVAAFNLAPQLIAERERLTADRDQATAIIRRLVDVLRRSDLDYIDQSDGAALPTDEEWTDALAVAEQYLKGEAS